MKLKGAASVQPLFFGLKMATDLKWTDECHESRFQTGQVHGWMLFDYIF